MEEYDTVADVHVAQTEKYNNILLLLCASVQTIWWAGCMISSCMEIYMLLNLMCTHDKHLYRGVCRIFGRGGYITTMRAKRAQIL